MKQPSPGMFRWSYIGTGLIPDRGSLIYEVKWRRYSVETADSPLFPQFSGKEKKALTYRRASALGTLSRLPYLCQVPTVPKKATSQCSPTGCMYVHRVCSSDRSLTNSIGRRIRHIPLARYTTQLGL